MLKCHVFFVFERVQIIICEFVSCVIKYSLICHTPVFLSLQKDHFKFEKDGKHKQKFEDIQLLDSQHTFIVFGISFFFSVRSFINNYNRTKWKCSADGLSNDMETKPVIHRWNQNWWIFLIADGQTWIVWQIFLLSKRQ